MGIQTRILIFVSLFALCTSGLIIVFNQANLKSHLFDYQDKLVHSSVKYGEHEINDLISQMEMSVLSIADFGAQLYNIKRQSPDLNTDPIVESYLKETFKLNSQSIGGGIWYQPNVFDKSKVWYGPYVYKENAKLIFTWDLSSPEYNYHGHDWYKNAFKEQSGTRVNNRKVYWSTPYYDDAGTESLMITVTAPIKDSRGKVIGVTTVDWAIAEMTKKVDAFQVSDNSAAFLIDKSNQQFIAFPNSAASHMQHISTQSWGEEVLSKTSRGHVSKVSNAVFKRQKGTVYVVETKAGFVFGVFLPARDFMESIEQITFNNLKFSLIITLILIALMAWILKVLFSPIRELIFEIQKSIKIPKSDSLITVSPIPDPGHNEFTPLVNALNQVYKQISEHSLTISQAHSELQQKQNIIKKLNVHLEDKVKERTMELELKTHEVLQVLERLKETQRQMVNMEKNAALGQLVAGIAHEINTPLGVCVTATSLLEDKYKSFNNSFQNNKVTRSMVDSFLRHIDQSTEILQFNLARTSDLIESFKQVSVDQSTGEMRIFSLADYISVIINSLHPKLAEAAIIVKLELDEDIEMNSYPGAISQIFNNLIMNSINHAFKNIEKRLISIRTIADTDNGKVTIIYHDNGNGIPQEIQNKVFEPFFTTKRGKGGTGLGMHVSYNLITQKLGGVIELESDETQGTTFKLVLPYEVSTLIEADKSQSQ